MLEDEGSGFGLCPSFSSYSINGFAEAAARVIGDSDHCSVSGKDHSLISESISDEFQEEEDFEFVSVPENEPAFPIFNHGALEKRLWRGFDDPEDENVPAIRISLEKLIVGDRDLPSSSSSEADELDENPPGTYCMWTPKTGEVPGGRCKKSKSTGSSSAPSKRWRLRDLLRRSNSDGKSSVIFLTPTSNSRSNATKNEDKNEKINKSGVTVSSSEPKGAVKSTGKGALCEKLSPASAHEVFYVHNRKLKEEMKRKSYLPYKQDLFGLWINFNAPSTPFPPF